MSDDIELPKGGASPKDGAPQEQKADVHLVKKRIQESPEEEEDHFKIMKLEGKIALALENGEFGSASNYLETVLSLQEGDPWRKIYTLLQMTVCFTKLQIHADSVATLRQIGEMVVEEDPSPEFVLAEADEYMNEGSYSKGFTMLYCACKLYSEMHNSDKAVEGIKSCLRKMSEQLAPLVTKDDTMKKGVIGHVIPAMKELAGDLKKITFSDPATYARANAWCMVRITSLHKECGQEGKVIKELERAAKPMKKKKDKCFVLGICLHNIGAAHFRLGSHAEARKYFKEAEHVYHNAHDMSDEERSTELSKTTNALKMLS